MTVVGAAERRPMYVLVKTARPSVRVRPPLLSNTILTIRRRGRSWLAGCMWRRQGTLLERKKERKHFCFTIPFD